MRLPNWIFRRVPKATPEPTIELADKNTRVAHRVRVKDFAAGRVVGGFYRAICGADVLPADLTAPERSHCPRCERNGL